MQKILYTSFSLLVWIALVLVYLNVSANTPSSSLFLFAQSATWLGSNNSQIQIFPDTLEYHNAGNNSSVIGNYFVWTYYDSVYGNFQMNWSANQSQNVRVVWITSACGIGDYGYKLGWYAYSPLWWYVDFDYNDSVFVYYCENSQSLRWYAYSSQIGFQNFSGIVFDINHKDSALPEAPTLSTEFVNPNSQITNTPTQNTWQTWWFPSVPMNPEPNPQTFSSQPLRFNGQTIEFIPENESFFYIIK